MGLYERMLKLEEPGISLHALPAIMGEFTRGRVTGVQIATLLGLDAIARTEAATLAARFGAGLTVQEFHDICLIAGNKAIPAYKTVAALKARLGV